MDATEELEALGFAQAATWGQGRGLRHFTAVRAIPGSAMVFAVTAEDRLLCVGTRDGAGRDLLDELSGPDEEDEGLALVHEAILDADATDFRVRLYVRPAEDAAAAEDLKEQILDVLDAEVELE